MKVFQFLLLRGRDHHLKELLRIFVYLISELQESLSVNFKHEKWKGFKKKFQYRKTWLNSELNLQEHLCAFFYWAHCGLW